MASEFLLQVAVSTQTEVVEQVKEPAVDPQEVVKGRNQLHLGTILHDAIWETFRDNGYERKLLYTYVSF